MATMEKYADTTEYPKLFHKTYWGRFDVISDEEYPAPEDGIIGNRNLFVKTYNIASVRQEGLRMEKNLLLNNRDKGTNCTADHIELYVDKDKNKMQVFSHHPNNGEPCGSWNEIPPMYSSNQKTWMRWVTNKDIAEQRKAVGW